MSADRPDIAFPSARPRGRLLSLALIANSAALVGLAYLLHCSGLACRPPPDGSNALAVIFILSALSLVIAWFVRPGAVPTAECVVADTHILLTVFGGATGAFEGGRTIAFADIQGFRHQPAMNSRGQLVVDLVPGAALGAPYVVIPLDGIGGPVKRLFQTIEAALARAGYKITGPRFRPVAIFFETKWTVTDA